MEYVGLVALVAAVVVALVTSSVGDRVTAAFERAVRCVVAGQAGEQCTARLQAKTLTPLERATRGTYVALGDSYSSGEGGSDFRPRSDQDNAWTDWLDENLWWPGEVTHNVCHRSERAYSQRVAERFDFNEGVEFHACRGAEIEDLLSEIDEDGDDDREGPDHANEGELPQLAHLDEGTSLVTLSIGGNGAGFADVVADCVIQGVNPFGNCRESLDRETRQEIRALRPELVELYRNIRQRAPNARVIVVGYPRIFPQSPIDAVRSVDDLDEPIDAPDQRWMNEMAALLSGTIKKAAAGAGVEYVDVYDALDGHEIGSAAPWINDLGFEFENGSVVDMASFHPDDNGQASIARRVSERIRNGG